MSYLQMTATFSGINCWPMNFLTPPNDVCTDQILADDNLFSQVCV